MPVSVSVLNNPPYIGPVNRELWFRVDSTGSGNTDFKYVNTPFYKKEPFATNTFATAGTYKVPPRPDTNNGLYSPHRNLKPFLQYNINPYISKFEPVQSGLLQYQIRYGCEYNPNLEFVDTISVSGNLGLTFSSAHDLSVGDIITINKTNKNYNPQYDGTCSITSIVNTYSFKTSKVFATSSQLSGESGVVELVSKISGTSSTAYTWSGTKQYQENNFDFTKFILGSASNRFLTNQPDYVKVGTDDYQTISFILPANNLTNWRMGIDLFDNSGSLIGTTSHISLSASNTYMRQDFGIGVKNLSNGGLTMSGVDTYRCFLNLPPDEPGQPFSVRSEYKYFKVDTTCSSYEKTRLVFLNRRGGFDYFNFTLDNKKMVEIKRTEYQQELAWNYSIGDRGQTILGQSGDVKYTANSNWITEAESSWLEELLTSPEVYILGNTSTLNTASTGYKLPIIITDTSYEVKTYLRNQIFNLVLNYTMANDLNLQNE